MDKLKEEKLLNGEYVSLTYEESLEILKRYTTEEWEEIMELENERVSNLSEEERIQEANEFLNFFKAEMNRAVKEGIEEAMAESDN